VKYLCSPPAYCVICLFTDFTTPEELVGAKLSEVIDILEVNNMNFSPAKRAFMSRLLERAQPPPVKPAAAAGNLIYSV
jgi:hypothetical protein